MARPSLTRTHRALLGLVAAGACLISGIGFAGSYSAVRELALHKGFGTFSYAFPIGVDAGIVVLLALDLVLTWLRIPFPLLRQTAWLLTVATISFNAAASWGDPLGMGMHAVIPVLFVVVVEASRHAVGRIAAITADRHMDSVRLMRWLLSPVPTFRLWRRMKLWELRSYDEVVRLEQNRLVYRAQLRFRYGRGWRRSAPIQALLPLKLAKYGVPLDLTVLDRIDGPAPAEVSAAGSVPAVSPAVAVPTLAKLAAARWRDAQGGAGEGEPAASVTPQPSPVREPQSARVQPARVQHAGPRPMPVAGTGRPPGQMSPWFKPPRVPRPHPVQPQPAQSQAAQPGPAQARPEQRAQVNGNGQVGTGLGARLREAQRAEEQPQETLEVPVQAAAQDERSVFEERVPAPAEPEDEQLVQGPELTVDLCVEAVLSYREEQNRDPEEAELARYLTTQYGVSGHRPGSPVGADQIRKLLPEVRARFAGMGRE
ncbi:hypothetical protein P3T36_006515 [Kitasatospora sp. MAP12-15]|uniref:DUF2637 domain-containing protein n=1 Tax=unclassified Kitasatospora TaxID=2633591 RepID=UPI0024731EC0|nr:DUF2637 domain-containing protein [Kitasatospora sp. MAP12-44]MDH6113152.1 hypothetical protein [Kitasatospora sp. MAP12-44]